MLFLADKICFSVFAGNLNKIDDKSVISKLYKNYLVFLLADFHTTNQ